MGYLKHFRSCADECADCQPSPCDSCCPTFTVEYRSRSASKTKCGFDEFGTPSSPPKKYLTKTQSGGLTDSTFSPGYTYTNTWSGAVTFSRPGCGSSDTRQLDVSVSGSCSASINLTGSSGQIEGGAGPNGLSVWDVNCSGTSSVPLYGCSGPTVVSTTVKEFASPPCGSAGAGGSTVTLTLSDEYTTSQLFTDTETAVAAASWSGWSTTPVSALYDLSGDELTITLRDLEIRVLFDSPAPAGCKIEFDLYYNGAFAVHYCYALTPGATSYTGIASSHPPFSGFQGGPGEFTYENFAITAGAC
jgi:hypothetical protein